MRLRTDAVEWREVEGEIVALDLRDEMYLGVNGSGAVLWPLLVPLTCTKPAVLTTSCCPGFAPVASSSALVESVMRPAPVGLW